MPWWPNVFLFGIFFVVFFLVSLSVCLPLGLLQVLAILFHVIYPFGFSVMFFLFIYLAPESFSFVYIRWVIHLSLCFLHCPVGRIFVHCFGRSCFTYSAYIFWVSLLSVIYFGFFLSVILSIISAVVFFFDLFIPLRPWIFSFLSVFALSHSLFICFCLPFPLSFCISVWVP